MGHKNEFTLTDRRRSVIQATLSSIPDGAHHTTVRESVLGSALCATVAALVPHFHSVWIPPLITLVRQVGAGKWSCSRG